MKASLCVVGACTLFALHVGPAEAGACAGEIGNLTKLMTSRDAGSGPTSGASAAGSVQSNIGTAQHPPTAIVGQEAQGKATSPEDVRRQTEGRPTTSQEAQSGQPTVQADKAGASAALDRARHFDRDGKEAECMGAVQQAKRLLGS